MNNVRVAGNAVQTQAVCLMNTRPEWYHCINLLGLYINNLVGNNIEEVTCVWYSGLTWALYPSHTLEI